MSYKLCNLANGPQHFIWPATTCTEWPVAVHRKLKVWPWPFRRCSLFGDYCLHFINFCDFLRRGYVECWLPFGYWLLHTAYMAPFYRAMECNGMALSSLVLMQTVDVVFEHCFGKFCFFVCFCVLSIFSWMNLVVITRAVNCLERLHLWNDLLLYVEWDGMLNHIQSVSKFLHTVPHLIILTISDWAEYLPSAHGAVIRDWYVIPCLCLCRRLHSTTSSSHMRVVNHNWPATKQHLHPQSVVEISHHSVLSGDRIRQRRTSSGSRHKDTNQCL